jgi:hypothetical protein
MTQPREAYSVLSRFNNLQTLKTSINVINENNGPLGVEPSRSLAIEMAGNFFKNNPQSRLESLEFTAYKGQYAPIQEFWVNSVTIQVEKIKGGVVPEFDVQTKSYNPAEIPVRWERKDRYEYRDGQMGMV